MQRWMLMLTAFLWIASGRAQGGEQLRLKWDELGSRITEKRVEFALPDGTRVEGKVRGVEQDGLRMDVSKSSNRRMHPKGNQLVAREGLLVLSVTEFGKRGRLLGGLGAAGIAAGIVAAQQIDIYEGPMIVILPIVIAGGIAGSAIGGYYTGKAFDKKVTEIWIVPE